MYNHRTYLSRFTALKLKTKLCTFATLSILALSGCASGPDFAEPAMPKIADGSFINQSSQTDSQQPLPENWWELYDDLALNGYIQEALSANTDLRIAIANLDRARAIYNESRSELYPSTDISAGASYGRDQTSWGGAGKAPKQWTDSGGLDISYELDFFGRIKRDLEAASKDTEAIAAGYDLTRVIIIAELTRAYVDSCAYGESIEVAQSSIELAQKSLSIIQSQQQAGSASNLDVERAGLTLALAEADLPLLKNKKNASLFELVALMGRTPAQIPDAAKACRKAPDVIGVLPIGDGTALLKRRPDIRQAENQLAADTARIGVAIADLYPHVTLGASANYLRNDNLKGNRTFSFGLGPLISWSFPNTVVVRSHIAQAKAQSAASLANFDGVVLNALKESEQSLSAYVSAMEQRDLLIRARSHAESAFKMADLRYKGGSISYLDVLDAQTSFINTRSKVAAADQQVGSARISVFKSLGGGWNNK